ncbi:MAG: S24/S26 family peptidase [Marinilabiliaceae bacterium]|nr:S24/S26 family peptidase [Marinilabiliaceae bacterium]
MQLNSPNLIRTLLNEKSVGVYETTSLGLSMFPLFKTGATIRCKAAELNSLKRGDIALFQRGEITVAHRIVEINSEGKIFTQGDSCLHKDEELTNQNYICQLFEVSYNKYLTFNERSIIWIIVKWTFLYIPFSHKINNVTCSILVRIKSRIDALRGCSNRA